MAKERLVVHVRKLLFKKYMKNHNFFSQCKREENNKICKFEDKLSIFEFEFKLDLLER